MATTYVDYVLAEDDRKASSPRPSKSPFVAIGSQMWTIWQTLLWFKHNHHREPTAVSFIWSLGDLVFGTSPLGYHKAPVSYPKNMHCE